MQTKRTNDKRSLIKAGISAFLISLIGAPSFAAYGDPVERMRMRMADVVGEELAEKSISLYNGNGIELLTFKAAKEYCRPSQADNCVLIVSQLVVRQKRSTLPKAVKTWCASEVLLNRTSDRYVNTVAIREDEACQYREVIY